LRKKRLRVSDQAVYDKLDGMELGVSAALVEDSAQQAAAVINALGARRQPWLPGYRVRILDGNHLSGTEHRLEELRTTWAAALPGKVLDVIEPETGLSRHVILTPDGHAQERSLLDEVLTKVEKRDLLTADRNFCTLKFLFGIAAAEAFFLIRQHGSPMHTMQRAIPFTFGSWRTHERVLFLLFGSRVTFRAWRSTRMEDG